MKILIASTNAGKVKIYANILDKLGLAWCSLNDIPKVPVPDETGTTATDNAIIKAQEYFKSTGMPVIANDSALFIHKLSQSDQPGVFVRRQQGKELSDDELLAAYIKKLKEVGGKSKGHYDVGLAIVGHDGKLHHKLFKPKRYFISTPSKTISKGLPLSSIAYCKKFGKYMSELTIDERNEYEGRALRQQAKFIKKILAR